MTPRMVACQAPLSLGFSRQEYWNVSPFSPPRDLLDPGIELMFPASPALASRFFLQLSHLEVQSKDRAVKNVCCYKTSVSTDSSSHDSVFLWQGFGWHSSNLKSFELCNFVCFALLFTMSHQSSRTFLCKTLHFQ